MSSPNLPDEPDIPLLTMLEMGLWLLRRRKRFRVEGLSMLPTLKPEEEVLVNMHAYGDRLPTLGDIVVVKHPQQPDLSMIKRVVPFPNIASGSADSGYWVEGDNAEASTDSRSFGPVPLRCIVGRVTCLFS